MRPVPSLLIGLIAGMLAAMLIGSIALDHNPQDEFADSETGVLTANFYFLCAVMTTLVGAPIALILLLIGCCDRPKD